jgi:ABC-type bacteriocin/lantibiotic exporter with double-glycine peptidase domain
MVSKSIKTLLNGLWSHMTSRRRIQFWFLLALMLIVAFAEILSIGAVLPFLGILTAPEWVFSNPYAEPLVRALEITTPDQLLLPLTIAFGLAALFAGAMRLFLLWASTRFSFAVGADLSISIYRRTLYQPYAVHCARNSSEVISGISSKANGTISIVNALLTLIGSTVILIAILVALLSVNPFIALIAFGGFGLIYIAIIAVTRKKLLKNSQQIALESTQVIKSLQEGLGGIRDVLMEGSQAVYCRVYRSSDLPLRRSQASNLFIAASPRYAMEALGMLLISTLAYVLVKQNKGVELAIPVLGTLALGAQRLLPILQQAYAAWVAILGGQTSLQDTLELLDQPLPEYADQTYATEIKFNHSITLYKIKFRYTSQSPFVLKNIELTIPKGSRMGFIGSTGSGKSTLFDIIMGLLQPTYGALKVDDQLITSDNNRGWQSHIAHVPQTIFLTDGTIEENIAFGIPKNQIDYQRVKEASQQAQIADTIESWPKQYKTFVGERGVRLSGGQRQRIGIARALYKQADIIIFDEATSALDGETEEAVMRGIESLSKNLTILIIAHRLTTLKNCTQIIELHDGVINRSGSYQSIIGAA